VINTLAYYTAASFTRVGGFIVEALGLLKNKRIKVFMPKGIKLG
jgi:hypothetical protein